MSDVEIQSALLELEELEKLTADRLRKFGMDYYVPNPKQLKAHQCMARTILYCGGNRAGKCLTADSLVETPEGDKRLGDLYMQGNPFKVYAWDGTKKIEADASVPFSKGKHECYRITMSDGRWIEAADRHRILMRNDRWVYVDELYALRGNSSFSSTRGRNVCCGQCPLTSDSPLETTSDIYLSSQLLSDRRSLKTEPNYRDGYSSDPRQCGEQLHREEDSDQFSVPLQDDVQEQLCGKFCGDGRVSRYSDNHLRYGLHHSSLDDQNRYEGQSSETLCQTFCTTCLLSETEPQTFSQQLRGSEVLVQSVLEEDQCSCLAPFSLYGNHIISYSPIGMQEVFDFEVKDYHNYFAGGLVNHNSTFGAMELCYHLTRKYPSWYPIQKRFRGPIKAVISATKYDIVQRVIEPKIRALLPSDYFRVTKTPQGYMNRIFCIDGSSVDVLTLEMKDESYESADWDFAWMDEPQAQGKRQAILRGLVDRRGREVITFTPLTEPWMKEELVDKADGKTIALFQVDIRDNKFDVAGKPILSEEAIKEFEASLPADVRDTRIRGVFFHLKGAVYKEFSDNHIEDSEYQYPDPVICVLDPHDRNPHHVIWASIDRQDDIHVDYELQTHCELDELAYRILDIEKARGYKMRRRIIDPNFGRRPSKIGNSRNVIQELARYGASFYEADDNIELGHMIVRDYLHYNDKKPLSAINKPKLFFHRARTPLTIRSMRNLQYDEWMGSTADIRNPKEVQRQKDDHGADCVRYLCISKPRFKSIVEYVTNSGLSSPAY